MTDLSERIEAIQRMGRGELRTLWRETFGEEPRSGNVQWMRKRLCWAVQAAVLGGLSGAAKQRIEELTPAALAWLPWGFRSFPSGNAPVASVERGRLAPGSILTRKYKDRTIVVTVRENGFEYDGAIYRSLTAIAENVTGAHWSGTHFFRLGRNGKRDAASA